jgi:hypothetical protein
VSPVRRGNNQRNRRRQPAKRQQPVDVWRAVPAPPPPEPIAPTPDPTALLSSLGPPPLQGRATIAEHYLAAVVERAAALANALAASADLLAEPADD